MSGAGSKNRKRIRWNTLRIFFGPSTTQMPADRLPQQNGMTRTDSKITARWVLSGWEGC